MSKYSVTTNTLGHFGDKGNCSCVKKGQLLFDGDGTAVEAETTCNLYATWENCGVDDKLQCYYGKATI